MAQSARIAFTTLTRKTLLLGAAAFAFASSPRGVPNSVRHFFWRLPDVHSNARVLYRPDGVGEP
jgi:hypothetical protein